MQRRCIPPAACAAPRAAEGDAASSLCSTIIRDAGAYSRSACADSSSSVGQLEQRPLRLLVRAP
jgi:hypothetical protein